MKPSTQLCASELGYSTALPYRADMSVEISKRIRALRLSLGKNQTQFGEMLGVSQGAVSRWESGSMPEAPLLAKLASLAGVELAEFIGADFSYVERERPRLLVKGEVAAGVWKEAVEWEEEQWFPYTGGSHVSVPTDRRFGLRVAGDSMNEIYPPGTILDCVSTIGSGMEVRSGQKVVVVRTRDDGQLEATVKQYLEDASGRKWLMPRSTNPAFQGPIEIGREEDGIVETVIMAVVVGAYTPEIY